jgi:zinc-ribbon domain
MYITNTGYGAFARPEAHITSKKSRFKVYDGKNIYLKDGTNFEIELHNPTSTRYMAKIWINGKLVSKSGIVVPAGDRVFIERFIDENAKFLFKTFEVDNIEETAAAREKNGLVKVEFYPEVFKFNTGSITTITPPVFYDSQVYSSPSGNIIGYSATSYYSSTSFANSSNTFSGPNIRTTGLGKQQLNEAKPDSVETGRVAQGEKSDQKFTNTTGDFYTTPYYTYEIHLFPESHKAIEANEIRNYCGECGVRIKKSNWKFCPNCGEKL